MQVSILRFNGQTLDLLDSINLAGNLTHIALEGGRGEGWRVGGRDEGGGKEGGWTEEKSIRVIFSDCRHNLFPSACHGYL